MNKTKQRRLIVAERRNQLQKQQRNRLISNSAISIFMDCPRKYKLAYVDGLKAGVQTNKHFEIGGFGHEYIDRYLKGESRESLLHELDLKQEVSLFQMKADFGIDNIVTYMKMILDEVDNNISQFDEVIATELHLSDNDNHGIIDLLAIKDDALYIMDWKFTKYYKTEQDILDNFQLFLYAKLLMSYKDIQTILRKVKTIRIGYISMPKWEPKKPRILKNGKPSKSLTNDVTYDTYMQAILECGCNPEDYEDQLNRLKNKKMSGFVTMKLNTTEFNEKLEDIAAWTELITQAREQNKFPRRHNCANCEYLDKCRGGLY